MGINRSSAELDALRGEVRQWLAEVISQPYGGPGFQRSGPICPYTGTAAANGDLLVEVHEGLDGSDRVAVRDFIAESVNRFCATISPDRWQAAMVIGLPDMPHTFGDDFEEVIINDEMGTWRQQRHAMASAFYNEVPNPTGQEQYPLGLMCPMPMLAVRYMSRLDCRFLTIAPHTLDAYLRLYEPDFLAGTLPPVAQAAVVAAHKHFKRPLPV
jgi:hypothetical protein